ncbi:monosaccharide ABC transporter ATP-binding protein, CUT2 family [Friedmanniella luteola]|uniref:Monosaccharide ABC transporter ATP-binding protein, CUT2 family n=1 Tax=Friedmanniella luteola TaxID=546871 RepID=A0A1H1ZCW3_9ACTN|nr:sugar ABC transporter ATP-binding protein [Friedmanniella luteola]SDT31510.1 monosaccharide ABC transporter ATP-binding protein, CUT2 family [Friedmanniella luteola]
MTAGTVEVPAPAADEAGEVVLRAVDIAKTYGVTRALKGVNFEVRRGQVTVLFGENGAGKSTLMKILSGVEQPSAGQLLLDGEPVTLAGTTDAVERGISIIHQELNLCANLSVRDNIFIGRELRTRAGGIDYAREREITEDLMRRLEEPIKASTLVQDLRVGQQQIIEIARALAADTRILIMDEPTSALSASEVDVLFKVIRDLTANGVAIVYISHHLEEAIEIADHAVVFRDGDLVATARAEDIDLSWVVRQMVGREADYDFRDEPREYGEVALSIQNVTVAELDTGRVAVNNLSLDVRQGEIVCLYGLMGAGRTELMEALAGRDPLSGGRVLLGGTDLAGRGIAERIELGLGLVPEDRQRDGLVQMMSVGANLSLPSLLSTVKRWFLSRTAERAAVEREISDVRVKTAGPGALITSLSGGNQQKVVIGKMLLTDPKVLLLDEPTRGIDVGAKGEIFSLLFREAARGLGVLYVTSEVGEALTASHRVLVMSKGRIVREFDPRTCTRDDIMAASGEHEPDPQQQPNGAH